jgi:hypothetical protein
MVRRSQRRGWLLFGLAVVAAAGCGPLLGLDEQMGRLSGDGGGPSKCIGGCGDDDPCTRDRCDEATATCEYIVRADGPAPEATQTAGDCQLIMCTDGVSLSVVDDGDLPDPSVCSEGHCAAGVASLEPLDEGTACDVDGASWCNGEGNCVECLGNQHCETPTTCGGGGEIGRCGCAPRNCASLGLTCGTAADGCWGVLQCDNGVVDGVETDVDCGGDGERCAERCDPAEICGFGSDCKSGFCAGGACDGPWSMGYGDSGAQHARALASDAYGNVVIAGEFTGTIQFGGDPLTSPPGNWSSFIVKLDAFGHHLWSKTLGEVGLPVVTSLAVDPAGNIVVAGSFVDTLDLGAGLIVGGPLPQAFVAKLDGGANPLWSVLLGPGPTVSASSAAAALAVDGSSKVVVGGQFGGAFELGGVPLQSKGDRDVFVVQLNTAGDLTFVRSFGHSGVQRVGGVAVAPTGAIAVVGDFTQGIDFGAIGGGIHNSKGDWDLFVVQLDDAGLHTWSRTFGDTSPQTAAGVAINAQDDLVLAGSFYGTVDFGSGAVPSAGGEDVYVAKLDNSGNALWANGYGDPQAQHMVDVAVDPTGDIVITGAFNSMIGFGPATLFSAGSNDVFVAKLDGQGGARWSQRFGDVESQTSAKLAITPFGTIVVVGDFHGGINFGQGLLQSAGGDDLFVAALAP